MKSPRVFVSPLPDYLPHKVVDKYFIIDWDVNHDPGDEDDGYQKALEEYFKLSNELLGADASVGKLGDHASLGKDIYGRKKDK